MAGRYLITGAQLGCLKALAHVGKYHDIDCLLREIELKHFVGDSMKPIKNDVKKIEKVFLK